MTDEILSEQIEYYRARAPEYDEWWSRGGNFDSGEEWNGRWFDEVAEIERALSAFEPFGDVLELACGTGWWTERLVRRASSVTAIDASDETIAIARTRAPSTRFVRADIFGWEPDRRYDFVFFSFWISHVPADRFAAFWDLVDRALVADGRVFLIDNHHRHVPGLGSFLERDDRPDGIVTRSLKDGRQFRAVKIYYDAPDLTARLRDLGWDVPVTTTEHYFYYGGGKRVG